MYNGIINIYKEKGFTSHDVVAKLRGILKTRKIGHTGTLDPDAEGVLPVCVGKATKLCEFLLDKKKTYRAKMLLGIVTDTQDITGKVLEKNSVNVTKEQIRQVIDSFIGGYNQIPPMYSALKVDGKKLYELAREGKEVERKPRRVELDNIEVLEISNDLKYVVMSVDCSKGTYIRTLCHDIGYQLGCGACMESLLRTRVDKYMLEDAITLSQVEELVKSNKIDNYFITVEDILQCYPKVMVNKNADKLLFNGNKLFRNNINVKNSMDVVRVYSSTDEFVALYKYDIKERAYKPLKMFL